MTNRVTPPPMSNDPDRPAARRGGGGDDGPPYDRSETAADPSHVHREEDVDNEDKALPSTSNLSIVLAAVAAVVAVLAIVLDAVNLDLLATILAVSAVVTGLVATALSWNDARGSPVVPAICTAAAVVVLVIIFLDILGADDKARELRDREAGTLVTTTIDDDEIPADPANIIEGTPEQRDIANDAVVQPAE